MTDITQAAETVKEGLLSDPASAAVQRGYAALDTLVARIEELTRDLTAVRAVCASIGILLQERAALGDSGPPNFALLAGAVEVYILNLEARIEELEGEYEALRETDLDHGLRLLRENTELRARIVKARAAMERVRSMTFEPPNAVSDIIDQALAHPHPQETE
jgi:hypothetical protein